MKEGKKKTEMAHLKVKTDFQESKQKIKKQTK